MRRERSDARVLVVGVGGLGCPALLALVSAGVRHVIVCDDDVVDRSNLHRQILFDDADVGTPKLEAAAWARRARAPAVEVERHDGRFLPGNAVDLARRADVVVEGSDNFATKFLASDACAVAGVPVVHASAVRWVGTTMAVSPGGRPCYRCLFEDVPRGDAPNCAEAGVMGPVVGVIAAAQADLALALLEDRPVGGTLVTFDGRTGAMRRRPVPPRHDCPLCGIHPRIREIDPASYVSEDCAT